MLPSSASSVEHHLVHSEASVHLEVEYGFGIGLVQGVLCHHLADETFLGHLGDPIDDDGLERIIEEYQPILTVGMDLATEPVGTVTLLISDLASDQVIVHLLGKELVDELDEDILCVSIVDVECGTIDSDPFTEFLDGNPGERDVLHHFQ